MPERKKLPSESNRLMAKFLFYSLFISLFPVTVLYLNSTSYFTSVSQLLNQTNEALTVVSKGQSVSEDKQKSLEQVQQSFNRWTTETNSKVDSILWDSYTVMGLTLIWTLSVALIIIIRFKRRLVPLETGFHQLMNNQFSYRIEPIKKDGIGRISELINTLAQHLENKENILKHFLDQHLYDQAIPEFPELTITANQSPRGRTGYFSSMQLSKSKLAFMIIDPMEGQTMNLFLTNYFQYYFKNEFKESVPLDEFCSALNQKLLPIGEKTRFSVGAFCGIVDLEAYQLSYVSSGFKGAICLSEDHGVQSLKSGDLPFGGLTTFTVELCRFKKGDKILFYNSPLTFEASQGVYSLCIDQTNEYFIKESSFLELLNKLPEVVKDGQIGECSVLFELKGSPSVPEGEISDYFETGTRHFLEMDYEKSLEAFYNVIRVHPDHLKALKNIGLIHYKKKEYFKARDVWMKVLSIDPDLSNVRKNVELIEQKMAFQD
ncbi:MAG TPA: hypothetical protein ENI73_09540 [Spirochaetes bacterium]|nr:hypothetical protein [Spirochaetota bacterium]